MFVVLQDKKKSTQRGTRLPCCLSARGVGIRMLQGCTFAFPLHHFLMSFESSSRCVSALHDVSN